MEMKIDEIRKHILGGAYQVTLHSEKERYAEDIALEDIETAILYGEILEEYPDAPRGISCLLLGYDLKKRPIHVVSDFID